MANDVSSGRIQDTAGALAECSALEAELAELRAAYEQYFSGIERIAPLKRHEALKKRFKKLKSSFIRQTATKFRINSLYAKYLTYERQWEKVLKQREDGTYRPDLERARRRAQRIQGVAASREGRNEGTGRQALELDVSEDVSLDDFDFSEFDAPPKPPPAPPADDEFDALLSSLSEAPTPAPVPKAAPAPPPGVSRPAAAALTSAPRPPSGGVPGVGSAARPGTAPRTSPSGAGSAPRPVSTPAAGVSDAKLRAVYDAYVTAKRRCNEDVSSLSFDRVASELRREVGAVTQRSGAKSVEFKVVIKDGRAELRTLPKG